MIQFALGLMAFAAAVALAGGFLDPLLPRLASPSLVGAILALLALLNMAHALFRAARDRRAAEPHALRTGGLMAVTVLAVGTLALALPWLTAPMALPRISGFPLSYYMAAQGILIALAIVAFLFARKQDAIDGWDAGEDA